MMRHTYRTTVLTTALALFLANGAAASPIGVNPAGDANGSFGAVSVVGDATTGEDCYDLPPPLFFGCFPLFAVSVTGDSHGGLVAVSGTGHADGAFISICASDPLACQPVPVASAPVVTGASLGPDGDGDGVPAHVRVELARASVNANDGTVTLAPDSPLLVPVDLADANPNFPVPQEPPTPAPVTALVPRAVAVGPDADGDGVPSGIDVAMSRVTVNPDGSFSIQDAPPTFVRVDPNDANPSTPVPSRPHHVTVTIPTSVAAGPDADGDGLPAFVDVQQTRVRLDIDPPAVTMTAASPAREHVDPDDGAREVDVQTTGDAEGSVLAVSATGDASSCEPSVTCIAISLTGDADGYYAASGTGDATACTDTHFLCAAASGTGDAQSTDFAVSALGGASGGDAGVSGVGGAHGTMPASGANSCNDGACVGVGHGHYAGVSPDGSSSGLVAASGTGDAEGAIVAVSVFGDASGPVAVSGCDAGACG